METSGSGKSLCLEAREYYYDLLCHDDAVPEAIARHVERCPFCLEQMRRLGDAVSEAGDPIDASDDLADNGVVEALNRQFEYLGEHVGCSDVKPFLPDLLIPSHQIRIPTPITVHIEHCPQCAKDLASIRAMGLTADQLGRLGRFFGRSHADSGLQCGQALSATVALAAFSLEGTDPEVLDHVSDCPRCRARVQRQRAGATADLPAGAGPDGVLSCDEVSPADLLDYILPFGLTSAAIDKADGRRDAIVTHVRACRQCMEKAQSLHETIYAIAARADSDVCTLYRSQNDAQDACEEAEGSAYRYPVSVQVLHGQAEPAADPDETAVVCGTSGRGALARLGARLPSKTTFAMAATVIVAAGLLLIARSATAMSVRDLLSSIERAANVHVVSLRGDLPRPSFEIWKAANLDLLATRTGAECAVYDLGNRSKRVIRPDVEPGASVKLTPYEFDRCATFMRESLGNIFGSALPNDHLSRVDDVPSDRPGGSLSVYELTRVNRSMAGASVLYQWRVFIDPDLQLPVKIESSRCDGRERPWKSTGTMIFTYPSEAEIANEIRALSPQQAP